MIDTQSPAFIAAYRVLKTTFFDEGDDLLAAFAAALETYEAARPKLPTITGGSVMIDQESNAFKAIES